MITINSTVSRHIPYRFFENKILKTLNFMVTKDTEIIQILLELVDSTLITLDYFVVTNTESRLLVNT